eukprot:TRINITY_DN11307_c0_g1_i2.p1 TRINITY_DN11307_c0_g1~~TRINITY_DN11307_c0_g1_i2.p1  ORF type:complete len:167 (-),score=69.51 TRINITY_DN11307_c0_g1_i2:298-798(-)
MKMKRVDLEKLNYINIDKEFIFHQWTSINDKLQTDTEKAASNHFFRRLLKREFKVLCPTLPSDQHHLTHSIALSEEKRLSFWSNLQHKVTSKGAEDVQEELSEYEEELVGVLKDNVGVICRLAKQGKVDEKAPGPKVSSLPQNTPTTFKKPTSVSKKRKRDHPHKK